MAFRDPQGLLDPREEDTIVAFPRAAGIACIAAALMFYFFARQRRSECPNHRFPRGAAIAVPSEYPMLTSSREHFFGCGEAAPC